MSISCTLTPKPETSQIHALSTSTRNLTDREGDQSVDVGVPVALLHGHPSQLPSIPLVFLPQEIGLLHHAPCTIDPKPELSIALSLSLTRSLSRSLTRSPSRSLSQIEKVIKVSMSACQWRLYTDIRPSYPKFLVTRPQEIDSLHPKPEPSQIEKVSTVSMSACQWQRATLELSSGPENVVGSQLYKRKTCLG